MSNFTTVFGSLDNFEKGHIEIIDDDPKNYAFSNMFEVANNSDPYEKIPVAKNLENAAKFLSYSIPKVIIEEWEKVK